jgi:mono/diheme cytochrome c family protein
MAIMDRFLTPKAVAFLLILVAVPLAVDAGWAADADNGARIAQRWCAACHVVAPDQSHANTEAPPFAELAKLPNFDAGKVAVFLLNPHPRMPDMNLTRNEAADLAAYIGTQR